MTGFFSKEVDLTDKASMIHFIDNHPRYFTGNSWNRCDAPSQNIKIYNLGLDKELEEKAWGFIQLEGMPLEFASDYEWLVNEFQKENNYRYTIGFNGRSDGYLVMYYTEVDGFKKEYDSYGNVKNLNVYPFRSVFAYDSYELEEMEIDELVDIATVIQSFDKLCDDIRDAFIYFLKNHEFTEETVTFIQERDIMVAKPIEE